MESKRALISGISGQDGSYLAEALWAVGYEVHGMVRRSSLFNRSRIDHLRGLADQRPGSFHLHYGDLMDSTAVRRVFHKVQPQEYYHLAGQSHVALSFEIPESTCDDNAMRLLGVLEICRDLPTPPRIFHAGSSEIFGATAMGTQQHEGTPHCPVTPYGCAKSFAVNLCRVYRDYHGLFVCNGIMFNHESPRRGENFLTKKVASTAARIAAGSTETLELGNLNIQRDWGYAPEFVDAMQRMLQMDQPEDYVLGTGVAMTAKSFVLHCFAALGMELVFEGEGLQECGYLRDSGQRVVAIQERLYRPADPAHLLADASKARTQLGWVPTVHGVRLAECLALAEAEALRAN